MPVALLGPEAWLPCWKPFSAAWPLFLLLLELVLALTELTVDTTLPQAALGPTQIALGLPLSGLDASWPKAPKGSVSAGARCQRCKDSLIGLHWTSTAG